ncbi:GntR family transcriptional regulator [Reyranella sp.]|uniref:GntR family transcriptional regulator n=1 Tax=Reyranella sp. TaxID=1929291 RepID=UPI0037831BBF
MSSPPAIPFSNAVPLYHQIALTLRARAENGALATEQQLCAEFGVSRTTVRQALGVLKQDGLLQSRRGVGTRFVGEPAAQRLVGSIGDPLHAGLGTVEKVVSIARAKPPAEVRAFLDIGGEAVTRLVRVHVLQDAPLSVVVTWMPQRYAPRSLKQSVHEHLWRRHGLLQKRSVHRIGVGRADTMVAPLLGVAIAEPVLHVQAKAYLDDGRPIRWTDNYFREERFAYQAEVEWKRPAGGRTANGRKGGGR